MPNAQIPEAVIPLTADGTALGAVTVNPTTVIYPGTIVNLYSSVAGTKVCKVLSVADDGTGVLKLGPVQTTKTDTISYGYSDVSAWKIANSATLFVEKQIVPVEFLYRGIAV